ncbi:hypothetical protein ACTTAI_00020 (plasmid) [Rhodobacter capsulatus]|uniref:hypothetical protein n=1 Tax=Rhodobacter capsulatus TaxID=1061 RepID=UPI00402542C1
MAATDGATVEIECVSAPDPAERFSGEWLFYVVSREGDRFMLVTATARERIINSPIGLFGMASGKLNSIISTCLLSLAMSVADAQPSGRK